MAINDLISKIILEDDFTNTFNKYDKKLNESGKRSETFNRSLAKVGAGFTVAATGAIAAIAAIERLTSVAVDNQQAMFNVAASAQAANREFGDNVGTIESWSSFVTEASDTLRVFGDRDVANATSRLIDMSKRLGLSEDQMKTLLTRTGDLSAGKTELTDGIERVTAAMRGEAEASEFLGLSLNETVVRNYAESLGLVFKNLTDNEKAQLRYQLFLDQSNTLQGRAAASAETLAGQEAELARLRERQLTDIGQNLIPLREAELAILEKLAGANTSLGGIILQIQASIQAALVVTAAGYIALRRTVEGFVEVAGKGFEALQSGDFAIFENAIRDNQADLELWADFVDNLGSTYDDAFTQIIDHYESTKQAQVDLNQELEAGQDDAAEFGSIGVEAAEKIAKAFEGLQDNLERTNASFNNRVASANFTHAQRLARLNESLALTTTEAAEQAVEARIAASERLAQRVGDIERNLGRDRENAERDFHDSLRGLGQEREDIERDLGRRLAAVVKTEADERLRINDQFGRDIISLERSIQRERDRVNSQFESEFAEADPFLRKQLERNRADTLTTLDKQEQDERAALDTQKNNALNSLRSRVAEERRILNDEAELKRERLEQERAELRDHFEREQADRDASASLAIERLNERHATELERINEQEINKVERAQAAIENENKNHADRLTAMQFAFNQELVALSEQLSKAERLRRDSYGKQLADAQSFASALSSITSQGIIGTTLGDTLNLGSGGGDSTTVFANITVSAAAGGFPQGQTIANSLADTLARR